MLTDRTAPHARANGRGPGGLGVLTTLARFVVHNVYDPRRLLNGRSVDVLLPAPLSFRLAYDADQLVTRVVRNESVFERWLTEFLITNSRPGQVAIDVGANVGYFTILMAKLVGAEGRVISVEPLYGQALRENLAINKVSRVDVLEAALSDHKGQVTIYQPLREDAAYASLRSRGIPERRMRVPCLTLDEICGDLTSLSWIKMDIEGAECHALRGGAQTITKFWPNIVLEWNSDSLRAMGTPESELYSLLVHWGYELFASSNDMGPLRLPTSREDAHTVLASRRAGELKLVPWSGRFY